MHDIQAIVLTPCHGLGWPFLPLHRLCVACVLSVFVLPVHSGQVDALKERLQKVHAESDACNRKFQDDKRVLDSLLEAIEELCVHIARSVPSTHTSLLLGVPIDALGKRLHGCISGSFCCMHCRSFLCRSYLECYAPFHHCL